MRAGRLSFVAAALAGFAAGALAQWSGSIVVESEYRYRGLPASAGHANARATLSYDGAGGGFAGLSATSVRYWGRPNAELLGYAGIARRFGNGIAWELGAIGVHFAGGSEYDYGEAFAGLGGDRWSTRLSLSPDYFGRSVRSAYLELNGDLPFDDRWRLFGHVGAWQPLTGDDRSRTDLRTGLAASWQHVELEVAWVSVSRAIANGYDSPSRHAWVAAFGIYF